MLDTAIEYLKGVGPQRADVLKKELGVFTCGDLLFHFPFRYIDRTKFHRIRDIQTEGEQYQIKGILRRLETVGEGRAKRLTGTLRDETGSIELVWFQAVQWLERSLHVGKEYVVFGRAAAFNGRFNFTHPEMEEVTAGVVAFVDGVAPVGIGHHGERLVVSDEFVDQGFHPLVVDIVVPGSVDEK